MRSFLKHTISILFSLSFLFIISCGDGSQNFEKSENNVGLEFEGTVLYRNFPLELPIDFFDKIHIGAVPDLPHVYQVDEGEGSLTPHWYQGAGTDHYRVFYRIGMDGNSQLYTIIYNPVQTSWPIEGLSHENEYYVCIKAENNFHQGEPCNAGNGVNTGWIGPFVPDPLSLPSAPVILNPVETNGAQIIVRWLRVEDASEGYDVKFESPRGNIVYFETDIPQVPAGQTPVYSDFNGDIGQTYYIRVRAKNENGPGVWSDEEEATPGLPVISLNHYEINIQCETGGNADPVELTINSSNNEQLEWEADVDDETVVQMQTPLNGVSPSQRDIMANCSQPPGEYSTTIEIWDHRWPDDVRDQITVNLEVTTVTIAIAAGNYHSCAIPGDGSVRCWGMGEYGQMGDGQFNTNITAEPVLGIDNAVAIASGKSWQGHSCAVLEDGTVKCWGWNYYGQLGDDRDCGTRCDEPVFAEGIDNAIDVSAGYEHTCALLVDGTVKCWGHNHFGQLGNGTNVYNSDTPIVVPGLYNAIDISAGSLYTCALLENGTIKCWGQNLHGQLGDGTTVDRLNHVTVAGISDAINIETGSGHTCAILANRTAKCWGRNYYGQLGNGAELYSEDPVLIPATVYGLSEVLGIDLSTHQHTCALIQGGVASCWGRNNHGQLGNGSTVDSSIPIGVVDLVGSVDISAEAYRSCAMLGDGSGKCWGSGYLGNNTVGSSTVPVDIMGLD